MNFAPQAIEQNRPITNRSWKRLYTMIAKAAVISHGVNAVRYATEKDKAEIIKLNLLPDDIPIEGIWQRMVIHQKKFEAKLSRYRPLKNTAIRIEVSPARNESEGWTHADWKRLTDDFVQEFDMVNMSSLQVAKVQHGRTSEAVSMWWHCTATAVRESHTCILSPTASIWRAG